MSTYRNGQIPARLLVRRGDLLLTAGTWAKFDDFKARIKRRVGVTLTIPNGSIPGARGEGAYRKYDMQVIVKAYWVARGQGRLAAAPGCSSHGGEFNGQDALAIDIDNWARVPLHIFFEEGRAAGFQMGYFDGKGGRPYEPWHIIDRDPYRKVPATAGEGEDDMTPEQARTLQVAAERTEAVYAALFGPANLGVDKTTWKKPYGEPAGEAYYGMFDVLIHSQSLIAQNAGQLAALKDAVAQLSAGSGVALNMKAIEDAAERGAKDALKGLTLTAKS